MAEFTLDGSPVAMSDTIDEARMISLLTDAINEANEGGLKVRQVEIRWTTTPHVRGRELEIRANFG